VPRGGGIRAPTSCGTSCASRVNTAPGSRPRGRKGSLPPSLYGRFDLSYDGRNPPKLLEYNADTPTSLIEAAIAQWHWLQELHPDEDQFNSLHERLIARWQALAGSPVQLAQPVHFACVRDSEEDRVNLEYLADTALQGGLDVCFLHIEDIGLDAEGCYVAKPVFSREGADIALHDGARVLHGKADAYGAEGFVYQALAPLPAFDGRYPVIGAWVVGDEPAGMGIREDATPITTNTSHFLPHYFS
jgi:glutathionylspermidine synthase